MSEVTPQTAYTPNLDLAQPTVGGDQDIWGGELNGNFAILDNALMLQNGRMSEPLNMGGFEINNVAEPQSAQDAATKTYVDQLYTAAVIFLGVWHVAANSPDITATTPVNGDFWICATADPNVPEMAPAGIPGIGGTLLHNDDWILFAAITGQWEVLSGGGMMTIQEGDARYLLTTGGTMSGGINMNGHGLLGLPAPVNNTDPATKAYADTINNRFSSFLPLSGGQMSGTLVLAADPTQPMHAADKRYVDNQIAATNGNFGNYLPLSGGTVTGLTAFNGGAYVGASGIQYQYGANRFGFQWANNYVYCLVDGGGAALQLIDSRGGLITGELDVNGYLRASGGRLISQSSYPTVSVWNVAEGWCGCIAATSHALYFGNADGNGNPTAWWSHLGSDGSYNGAAVTCSGTVQGGYVYSTGDMRSQGNLWSQASIYGNGTIYPNQGDTGCYFSSDGTNKYVMWQASGPYYMYFSGASGNVRNYGYNGEVNHWGPAGDLHVTGNVYAANVSDVRTKKNMQSFARGLQAIRAQRTIRWEHNGLGGTNDDGRIFYGWTAQDAREALPEAVYETPEPEPPAAEMVEQMRQAGHEPRGPLRLPGQLSLDRDVVVAALLNAVQELAAELDTLKARLA